MKVELLHNSPLLTIDRAIGKCWDKQKSGVDLDRIHRVGHKNKHESTLEHVVYTFDIDGVSRALLQELARHRIASLSVKSTRYTLNELKHHAGSMMEFLVDVKNGPLNALNCTTLEYVKQELLTGMSVDKVKYSIPEAYKTSLVWTINMRSLRNFIALRSNKAALWEIRQLAYEVYKQLPTTHKFMFAQKLDSSLHGEWEKDLVEAFA